MTDPDLSELIASMNAVASGAHQAVTGRELLQRLLRDSPPAIKAQVACSIRTAGPDELAVLPQMLTLLEDPGESRHVVRAIASAIGRLGHKAAAAAPALIRVLRDTKQSSSIRQNAAMALTRVAPAHAGTIGALRAALADPSRYVGIGAALAMTTLREQAAPLVPDLIASLERSRNFLHARYMIQSLGAVGERAAQALPLLRSLAEHADSGLTYDDRTLETPARAAIAAIHKSAEKR